jgi:hypothetical protein
MRTDQMTLRFDEGGEQDPLWESIPLGQKTQIACLYARLLTKIAKVQIPNEQQEAEGNDK